MTRTRGRRRAPAERPAAQPAPPKQPVPPERTAPEEPERPVPDAPVQPADQPVRTPTRLCRTLRLPAGKARHARRTRRWPAWCTLPACAAVGALSGGVYGTLKAPQYTATSYVLAVPENKSDSARALGFAQAYGRVATQVAVLGDAPVSAGVPMPTLRSSVRAETSPDAPMIAITATSSQVGRTADMANAVSRALISHANRTHRETEVRLVQFSQAVDPVVPASVPAQVTSLVGGCAGALVGSLALLSGPRRRPDAVPAAVPGPTPEATPTDTTTEPDPDDTGKRATDHTTDRASDLEGSRR